MGFVVSVIGGDKRFDYLRELLSRDFVYTEDFTCADIVVLPMPMLDSLGQISGSTLKPEILAGLLKKDCVALSAAPLPFKGVRNIVYGVEEQLLLQNARLTAEGALELYMRRSERSVLNARVLVTGFGRVARAVCELFSLLGANITVAARSAAAREEAVCCGYAARELNDLCGHFDAVFNTVPAPLISARMLRCYNADTVFVELASKPYGFDLEGARASGYTVELASGLPGKTAPCAAACVIHSAILRLLKREGVI